jgi:putative hemolysin
MDLILLFALIALNGLLAMSEMALVAAKKVRLQKRLDEGSAVAQIAIDLGENPNRFLSTIQIGLTSISVLNGIVGESLFALPLSHWLIHLGVPDTLAQYGATLLVVVLITYFSIVLGELVPKRLGQAYPETIACLCARPLEWLATCTKPFVSLLMFSTQTVMRLLGVRENQNTGVTEEEIHAVLAEGTTAGVIESQEHTMVRNVFRLDDRQIGSLMVPRVDVAVLDLANSFENNLVIVEQSPHGRFPVVRGGWHDLLGVVDARQWLTQVVRLGTPPPLDSHLQTPLYVPETLTGMELLDNFRSSDMQMAFVVDEYGQVLGIVTLQDLVEAITGEFQPRNPETAWALQREDGSWLLDGHIPIPELKDRLGLNTVPEEDKDRYHTLSGMLMLLTGRLLQEGEGVNWDCWRFEIVDRDGQSIDKVLATPKPLALPFSSENHAPHSGA